jgi:hypothetical protein
MKIYIANILPETFTNKMSHLINVFGSPRETIKCELLSKESGYYFIKNDTLFQRETTFKTNYEIIKGYQCNDRDLLLDLLVDATEYTDLSVRSQLPVEYIYTKKHELTFTSSPKAKLSLVFECLEEMDHFEKNFVPVNFYFEYNENHLDITNMFFQEELNVFLLGLI